MGCSEENPADWKARNREKTWEGTEKKEADTLGFFFGRRRSKTFDTNLGFSVHPETPLVNVTFIFPPDST